MYLYYIHIYIYISLSLSLSLSPSLSLSVASRRSGRCCLFLNCVVSCRLLLISSNQGLGSVGLEGLNRGALQDCKAAGSGTQEHAAVSGHIGKHYKPCNLCSAPTPPPPRSPSSRNLFAQCVIPGGDHASYVAAGLLLSAGVLTVGARTA